MANLIYRQIEVSPRRWLTIPLEYANREFAGTAILALEAAERGWGTIFGSKIIRTRSNLPRGVIIERWITRGMLPKLAASYMRGSKLTAWCEEGLVYPDAAAYGRRKVDHKAYGLLDAFFAWGRNQADDLVKKLGCDGSKLTITGNPRFDLYRTDLRGILSKKVSDIKAEHGNFILVNTSFPDFNGSFTPEFTFAKLHKLAVVPSAELESEVRGRALFQTELFGRFVELIELLCRHFPSYRIIVRPHPSEELGLWKQSTAAFPNVKVFRTGNVAEWILASSVCVHNNCTTGVEAYLLNKTSVAYSPITHPRFDLFLPNALSVRTFAPEETLSVIDRVLNGGRICSDAEAANKAEIARHFIANIDGPRASEQILEALDALPIKTEALSLLSGKLRDLRTAVGRKIALAKSTVRGGVGAIQKRSSKHNLDGLSKKEMLQFLKEAKAASGRFNDVQVVELEKNVLCVYAEPR